MYYVACLQTTCYKAHSVVHCVSSVSSKEKKILKKNIHKNGIAIITEFAWDLGMCCSSVCLLDNKIPLESSYLHITQYHGIVENIRQSFKCYFS